MSASRHPIALRLEQRVGEGTRLLGTVMALPLLDGIFVALVMAGAVSSLVGILEVGLLIFGGSATVAVVLAEMEGDRRRLVSNVLLVGAIVVPMAAIQTAIAPTIASLIEVAIFERFAALVILAVAAKTASAQIGEHLPKPGVIIVLGLVASIRPGDFEASLVADPTLILYGTGAAAVGVAFALGLALTAEWHRRNVDLDRFRFGSAVALGVLPLSILGIVPSNAPLALAVLGLTAILAFDPGAEDEWWSVRVPSVVDGSSGDGDGPTGESNGDGGLAPQTDGGDTGSDGESEERGETTERPPWF